MSSAVGQRITGASRLRGLARKMLRSSGITYNRFESVLFDLWNKTDTTGKIAAGNLDIPEDIADQITGYQSVNEGHLRAVLNAVEFPGGSTFVDIGCGKGKALLIAARSPFITRLVGLELAQSLCAVAERNVEIARARGAIRAPAEIVHGDALAYPLQGGENIFFLNNPFDAILMKQFIDGLEASAVRHPRRIWVLYYNPVHTDAIMRDGRLSFAREFKFFGPGRNLSVFELR